VRGALRKLPPAGDSPARGLWIRLAGDVDDPRRGLEGPARRNLRHIHAVLAAGACVDCGERDVLVLEFDHVGGDKVGQVSTMAWNVSLATLTAEIAKCELRCCNCHRRVTYARRAAAEELESAARPP